MGVTDRLRASLGGLVDGLSNPSRYGKSGEVDLDETTSPNTWRDETKQSKIAWLASRKRQLLSLSFVLFYVALLFAAYTRQFAPGLYQNPWLIEALKYLFVVPLTFVITANWMRGKLKRIDWVVMLIPPNGLGVYVGSLEQDTAGNTLFTPVKGFDFLGLRGRNLTLGDLGNDFAQNFAKMGRDAGDDAKVRLEDALYVEQKTFFGTVCGVLTSGLELDEFGRESDVYTAPPDLVDQERYKRLSKRVDEDHDHNAELQGRLDAAQERIDHWREEAQQTREEYKQELVDTHTELSQAGFTPRGGRARGGRPSDPAAAAERYGVTNGSEE